MGLRLGKFLRFWRGCIRANLRRKLLLTWRLRKAGVWAAFSKESHPIPLPPISSTWLLGQNPCGEGLVRGDNSKNLSIIRKMALIIFTALNMITC